VVNLCEIEPGDGILKELIENRESVKLNKSIGLEELSHEKNIVLEHISLDGVIQPPAVRTKIRATASRMAGWAI